MAGEKVWWFVGSGIVFLIACGESADDSPRRTPPELAPSGAFGVGGTQAEAAAPGSEAGDPESGGEDVTTGGNANGGVDAVGGAVRGGNPAGGSSQGENPNAGVGGANQNTSGGNPNGGVAGASLSTSGGDSAGSIAGTPTSGHGGGGSAGWGGNCFERGSSVATPRGSVAIETLRVGDDVLAFDERSASVVARPITATYVHTVAQTGRLRLADGRVLRMTAEHPVYLAAEGRYARADEIAGKAAVVTLLASPGATAARAGVGLGVEYAEDSGFLPIERPTVVYNISVGDLENYFVEGVLVHNKSGGPGNGGSSSGGAPSGDQPCAPSTWSSSDCTTHPTCLDYRDAVVATITPNQPADEGPGFLNLDVTTCPPPPLDAGETLLAVDVLLPESPGPRPGFAVYSETSACEGTFVGEVRDPMEPAGWTTQCITLMGTDIGARIALVSLDGYSLVKNPRFVQSCQCKRDLKRSATCTFDATLSPCY